MSTLILSAVGGKYGSFWGGVGALAGYYIDQRYLYPSLFPKLPVDIPKLGDFALQQTNEGSPVNICFGPENRLAGTIIWLSDIREQESTEGGGWKEGPEVTSYAYFVDLAIAVCVGEIQNIKKIWADGAIIYDADPDIDIQDKTDLAVTKVVEYSGIGGYLITMEITSSTTDLSNFKSGVDVLTSGFVNGGNNGTFRCESASLRKLRLVNSGCVTEAAGATIDLFQDLPTLDITKASEMTVYVGSTTQDPDDLIESIEGNSPAFRGISYVVLESLALQDFGNRLPQFHFLVAKDTTKTIASAIENILELAGLTSAQYDTSTLTGNIRGYNLPGVISLKDALDPLLTAYDIMVRESGGKLIFEHRTDIGIGTFTEDKLAAHEDLSEAPRLLSLTDGADNKLPQEVNVQFLEADINYQKASQREVKNDAISNTVLSIDIPLVMDATDAREVARRELWIAWANRQAIRFTLPPSYYWVESTDRLQVTVDGEVYIISVKSTSRGADFIIFVEGVVEQILVIPSAGVADDPGIGEGELYIPPELRVEIIDIAPFTDSEVLSPGLYLAICAADIMAKFKGAVLYDSIDDITWASKGLVPTESIVGVTIGPLSTVQDVGYWDRINTIQVNVLHGTLSSKSEVDVLSGQNWAVIGNEVIAFRNAVLVDTNRYELSLLLRGLRGTEDEVGGHSGNERFVILNTTTLSFKTIASGLIGSSRYYKGVPSGGVISEYLSAQHNHSGGTVRPFAVCHVSGERDVSSNLAISWKRRTKYIVNPISQYQATLDETTEAYEIDIYNAGWTAVLRTITAATPAATYTAAQQITDFGSPQSLINMKIYQLSDVMGRGRPRKETV